MVVQQVYLPDPAVVVAVRFVAWLLTPAVLVYGEGPLAVPARHTKDSNHVQIDGEHMQCMSV